MESFRRLKIKRGNSYWKQNSKKKASGLRGGGYGFVGAAVG